MYALTKTFYPTMPGHWSLWKLFKISAMTVRERLESYLTLSYTLNHLSLPKDLFFIVLLYSTLLHTTLLVMYVRKNLFSQVSLCDTLKFNELSKGKEVSETDRKLTKICQKSPKGEPYIISENTQNVINMISRKY